MRMKLLAALTLLGGCVPTSFYTRPVPLAVQADQFNTTAAETERLMIVRNVMRARDRTSMVFTRLTGFNGSMQRTLSATASLTAHEGGDGGTATPGVTMGGQATPSFTMAILNDQRFHRAMQSSIDLGVYESLLESGWSPILLHTLFVERVEFVAASTRYDNTPGTTDFADFQTWLRSGTDEQGHPASLRVCSNAKPLTMSPPMAAGAASNLQGSAAIAAQQLELRPQGDTWQVVRPHDDRWLAFNCEDREKSHELRVTVRSVEGVLYYLGELVREGERSGRPVSIDFDIPSAGQQRPLFVVQSARGGHPSGIVFRHEDGETYYVPYADAAQAGAPNDRTQQIISLMLQLIGVLQERQEAPATITAHVVP